jgi:hypothetical protein
MKLLRSLLPATVVVLTATACYQYVPVATPRAGMDVRARLETEAAVRRSQGTIDPIVHYDGEIVEITPEFLALDVLIARSSSQFQDVEIRDTVRLRTDEVQSIEERKVSPIKTALVTVGAAVAVAAVVLGIDAIVGGTGDDGNGNGTPPAIRVPILGWVGARLAPVFVRIGREE